MQFLSVFAHTLLLVNCVAAAQVYQSSLIGSCVLESDSNQGWDLVDADSGIALTPTPCIGGGKCHMVTECTNGDCLKLETCVRTKKRCLTFDLAACHVPLPARAAAIADESQLLIPSHSAKGDQVGANVAKSGNCIFMGAPADDSLNPNAGAVHVACLNSHNQYQFTQKLFSSTASKKDAFGHHVEAFGSTLFVSAEKDDTAARNAGAVYVFEASTSQQWTQRQILAPGSLTKKADFGASLAVEDGLALIGAPRTKVGKTNRAGVVYAFAKSSIGHWDVLQVLSPSKPAHKGQCGEAVAVAGTFAAFGCPGSKDGSVYVFKLVEGRFKEMSAHQQSGEAHGFSIQLFSNELVGSAPDITLVVGAPEADKTNGKVYIYTLGLDGQVIKTKELGYYDDITVGSEPLPVGQPRFGHSISLSDDGTVLAVGAPEMASKSLPGGRGSLFVYRRAREWGMTARAHGKGPDTLDNLFGADVELESGHDGRRVMAIVGAPKLTSSGAVHVLVL
eukprot:m.53785 g.53785  ORF g.53785 m.53785 type:complete len:505 (+) comp13583_c0_seq1:244-1758(+)